MTIQTVRQVMTDSVVSVSPETPLVDVLRLFVEEEIHGAPVIANDGELVGIVTSTDLLRAETEEHDSGRATGEYLRELVEFSGPDWSTGLTDFQDRLSQLQVSDVMTEGAVCVEADAAVSDAARLLRENRIHRVWVVEKGRLCGVVSTLDLMPIIERTGGSGQGGAA